MFFVQFTTYSLVPLGINEKKNVAAENFFPNCSRALHFCLSVSLPKPLVGLSVKCTWSILFFFAVFFLEFFCNKVGNLIARMGYCHCKPMHPLFAQWGIFASINVIALKPCSCIVSNFQYFLSKIYVSLSFV